MANGAKRNKLKNALSPSSTPTAPVPIAGAQEPEGDLLDDLFAELDNRSPVVQEQAATILSQIQVNRAADTPPPPATSKSPPAEKKGSKQRFKEREARTSLYALLRFWSLILHTQARKIQETLAAQPKSDPEADARLQREAELEEKSISASCDRLGLQLFEIQPDGHCLFSAVADQLGILGILPSSKISYTTTRHAAASYMFAHPNDFIPFLPSPGGEDAQGATDSGLMTPAAFEQYCKTVRDTGLWGGEPEIMALARAYDVPIHVVQTGPPPVVVHAPDGGGKSKGHVVYISYHRRMYGLGEHYNSLRPKSKGFSRIMEKLDHTLISP